MGYSDYCEIRFCLTIFMIEFTYIGQNKKLSLKRKFIIKCRIIVIVVD